jgi:hypothetical protein
MDATLTAAAIGAGGTVIVGLAGFWANVRNTNKLAGLTEQGQLTDRYSKAIEQLGSDKLDVRVGGIYALERVARDSPRDHLTVMEVLAAFIREHSLEQWTQALEGAALEGVALQVDATRPDVQAAATVIGRRTIRYDSQPINLSSAHLPRADLTGAKLADADLAGADLTGAKLPGAWLIGANFSGAILIGTNLSQAFLTGADFTRADLSHALWPESAKVPRHWQRDNDTGRLKGSESNSDGLAAE